MKIVIKYRYRIGVSGESKLKKIFFSIITFWIPKSSPDYDEKIELVDYWYLEIDTDTGCAIREIGFDNNDNPILFAPTDKNYGFWTDSDMTFKVGEEEKINKDYFDKIWVYLFEKENKDTYK